MPSKKANRTAACALAAALTLVAVPLASAGERAPAACAGRQARSARLSTPGTLERAWGWLTALWEKNGVLIDPNGVAGTPPPSSGTGSTSSSTLAPLPAGGELPL
jgi:hypothetical protein